VNSIAAAALAAGELICEFSDGYRKSLLAEIAGDPPRTELVLVFEALSRDEAQVLSTAKPGRRTVQVRATDQLFHLIEREGPSVRVTTLTGCTRTRWRGGEQVCTRFDARYAWHFDTAALVEPDASFKRQPSGAALGSCEPWRIDP
jgi:hypothetical protein